ncbi:ABC transporter ATP-binding protein [Candidatus Bipolaricaulota bacterium]
MDRNVVVAEGITLEFKLRIERSPTLHRAIVRGPSQRTGGGRHFRALEDISFAVGRGETLGIIGPNGSGKSTLLRVVGGIYKPDTGEMYVSGRVSTLLSLTAGFQAELSGRENISLVGMLLGFGPEDLSVHTDDIIDFADIGRFIDAPVKTYSSGMTARLGFAIASHLDCDVLLVDEILGVGDRSFRGKSKAKISELLSLDRTVLLVSHDLTAILDYSTRVLWLEDGKVAEYGEPEEVVDAYRRKVASRQARKE